jgi:hypothetical protein
MAVAAVLMLCVSASAQAGGSRNDADYGGGYPVGPMGQIFDGVNPALHPAIFGKSDRMSDQPRARLKAHNR